MTTPIVFVVYDDESVRASLKSLIEAAGWQAETFASAQEFLCRSRAFVPGCLIFDIAFPDLSGLDLQKQMAVERPEMPAIFVTGCGDVYTSVQAMKAGAMEFLTKPFRNDALLSAIEEALRRSHNALDHEAEMQLLRGRYASLSVREREVMELVVSGLLNKHIRGKLGISEITVKAHRGKVMRKMQADSLADLVNIAARLHVAAPKEYAARSFSA